VTRYAPEHKDQVHRRIVSRAAVQLRQKGVRGVSVAELMQSAGLTHGGFYAHFASKEALIAEACSHVMAGTAERLSAAADGVEPLASRAALIEAYLSPAHRDDPGRGCVIPALGAELGREGPAIRQAFSAGLQQVFDIVAECTPASTPEQARQDALATVATLVGTLLLARAAADSTLATEILDAGRAALLN
jgi:TetR/AcrR family transcriptional regulator, transcriptional repressor for nem operon